MVLGELIFGIVLGNIGDAEFSGIVLMVILTPLIPPPMLTLLIRRTAARSAD